MNQTLEPVLIGADLNSYNLARAFHEAYGVVSHVFGRYETSATLGSRIVKFHKVPSLNLDEEFVREMTRFAEEESGEGRILILLGCTDDYANLIARNRSELEGLFLIPYNDIALMNVLQSKERFYESCETYGIPYPKTQVVRKEQDLSPEQFSEKRTGFPYPIIVKPANSIEYWKHPFEGMNKVYVSSSPNRTAQILSEIFGSGYSDSILLQDMIPGNDSNMYVLTAYCGEDKKVKMMCLGHVLLEEHSPKGRGNHAAIVTEYKPELCERFRAYLEGIGYTGFANFDIKFDSRDGSFRAFEVNLRQGRSNYYVSATGANLARCLVEDRVLHQEIDGPMVVKEAIFWHSIPKGVIWKYTHNDACVTEAKELIRRNRDFGSVWYAKDLSWNPKRWYYILGAQIRYIQKYHTYCKDYR